MRDEFNDQLRAAARDAEMSIARRRVGDRWLDVDELPTKAELCDGPDDWEDYR